MTRLLPPGPTLRETLQSASLWEKDPIALFCNRQQKFGDVVTLGRIGRINIIALFHPDGIEQVLQKNTEAYERGPSNAKFAIIEGQGLFVAEGPEWLHRRRTVQPLFHRARLDKLACHATQATQELCAKWQEYSDSQASFDVVPELLRHQFTIAGPMLFGTDLSTQAAEIAAAVEIAREQVTYRIGNLLAPPEIIPTPRNRRFNRAKNQLETLVASLIAARRETPESNGATDALSVLLNAINTDGTPLSPRQLRDEVMTMIVAGHHPTAMGMAWSLYLLATHPEVQQKMRAEVLRVLNGRTPDVIDLEALPFTRAVNDEALRLYPPIWSQSRRALVDDSIGGFHIPRGSLMLLVQAVAHRHPQLWPSPNEFCPERFLPNAGSTPAQSTPAVQSTPTTTPQPKFAYFPFGGGPRACLGSRLALTVLPITLAAIVQRFQISYDEAESPRIFPGVSLAPKNGLRLSVRAVKA